MSELIRGSGNNNATDWIKVKADLERDGEDGKNDIEMDWHEVVSNIMAIDMNANFFIIFLIVYCLFLSYNILILLCLFLPPLGLFRVSRYVAMASWLPVLTFDKAENGYS